MEDLSSAATAASFSPINGRVLVTCGGDGSCIVYNATVVGDYTQVQVLKEHSSSIRAVAFSPTNENILVICSRVGSCIVYDATEVGDYKQVQVMQDHTGEVNVATFSPTDGNMMVTHCVRVRWCDCGQVQTGAAVARPRD